MTAVIRSVTQMGTTAATSTIPKPAGVVAGDLLLIYVFCNNASLNNMGAAVPSGGFTQILNTVFDTTSGGTFIYRRIADGSEGSTFGIGVDIEGTVVCVCIEQGTFHPSLTGMVFSTGKIASNATAYPLPALTTTVDDCLVLSSAANHSGIAISTYPGNTLVANPSATGADGRGLVASEIKATAGLVTARTFTLASGDQGSMSRLAIPPAPAPVAAGSFFYMT